MKKCMRIILISFVLMFLVGKYIPTPKVYAGKDYKWKALTTQKVIDMDPLYSNNELGMMVHFENGYWCQFWKHQLIGGWPGINEYGTFSHAKKGDKNIYKWEKKKKPKKRQKSKNINIIDPNALKIDPIIVDNVPIIDSDWTTVNILPEIKKVVVIKFHNDRTATAYINDNKEWKLDINKDQYKGGKTIIDIKEWKDIGL